MLIFVCPHCEASLRIAEKYLGQKGRCKKCGGRIALLGKADATAPQRASRVGIEERGEAQEASKPATEKQCNYLRTLGMDEAALTGLNSVKASEYIDQLRKKKRGQEPPTEKQLDYLRRLGASTKQIQTLSSKEAASTLIEEMHLLPTAEQLKYLKNLGASGAQLATIRTRGHAAALIDELNTQTNN